MRRFTGIVTLAVAVLLSACTKESMISAKSTPSKLDIKPLVTDTSAFATDLYARLAGKPGNLFFSPYSIDSALAMTYAGARGNTAKQMMDVLHLQPGGDRVHAAYAALAAAILSKQKSAGEGSNFELVIANALWGQKDYGYQPSFIDLLNTNYNAGLHEVNFLSSPDPSRLQINDWVSQQTHDRIKDLIPSTAINSATRLVLTNAIYFKSQWMDEFSKSMTKDEDFHLDSTNVILAATMHRRFRAGYGEADDLQILDLPYIGNQLSMLIVLPKQRDGLSAVEKQLTTVALTKWDKSMKTVEVQLSLPKFKLNSQFQLADELSAMGMPDAFDAKVADFSGMVNADLAKREPPVISQVVHKAFVEVDEDGTEAAAATAVVMRAGSAMMRPAEPIVFRADHPFLFMIRHNETGAILFMGRMNDPRG